MAEGKKERTKMVLVFGGSRDGNDPEYKAQALQLGAEIAKRGLGLIYGGGRCGLMAAAAQGAHENGAKVIGIIPNALHHRERGEAYGETIEVRDMNERKVEMFARADYVVSLPGGFGTYDELFEALTLNQLGAFRPFDPESTESHEIIPVGLVDTAGFYTEMCVAIEKVIKSGFADEKVLRQFVKAGDPVSLLDLMMKHDFPKGLNLDWKDATSLERKPVF